ncbi:hypothetical protein DQ04_08831000 [Trypanosoma grayi]|uniref:hypothetical protein n=1 Tax=Trypanosoma grayi TaxID=71804 RepID=UPI0004F43EF7|nr:hypothetical protein DQ04_08831000 [Trypanosoma grayi]KEG07785.1 hypothetical protein DQ04_08831000 [Trypanosoma grayi]
MRAASEGVRHDTAPCRTLLTQPHTAASGGDRKCSDMHPKSSSSSADTSGSNAVVVAEVPTDTAGSRSWGTRALHTTGATSMAWRGTIRIIATSAAIAGVPERPRCFSTRAANDTAIAAVAPSSSPCISPSASTTPLR